MSKAWFPVTSDQVTNKDFINMTAREKLQYWLLASEFNFWGEYKGCLARSDMWFAVALSISEIQARTTRKKFQEMGWIEFESGKMKGKIKFSTEYQGVKWSTPPKKGDGFQFAEIHKHAFNMLLKQIEYKRLSHDDVMVYVYLYYWYCVKRRNADLDETIKYNEFFISKKDFVELVGSDKYLKSIKNLYDGFKFTGDSHLFTVREEPRRIVIQKLSAFADPSNDEAARKNWDNWYSNIDYNVKEAQLFKEQKAKLKAKTKNKIAKKSIVC